MGKLPKRLEAGMIVTRTPLRVSFVGGGTDLPAFYEREYGAVISTTIDKYLYVTLKRHSRLFKEEFRLNYSETEHVQKLDDIKNDIARECLRFLEISPPVYISTVADVPAASGLGSSSSFCVGLLNALHTFKGEKVSAGQLAEEAAHIEINVLKRPVGKQDPFAAAYGGINLFLFMPGGGVTVEPQRFAKNERQQLFENIMMFWTGMSHDSRHVLSEQKKNIQNRLSELRTMRDHAHKLQEILQGKFCPRKLGVLLDQTWKIKRNLANTVTNESIDHWYAKAMKAGALGGKLCGAGGGGFLMFIVPQTQRAQVKKALVGLAELRIKDEPQGSRVLTPHVE